MQMSKNFAKCRHSFHLCKTPHLRVKYSPIIKVFTQDEITKMLRHAKRCDNALASVKKLYIKLHTQTHSLNSKTSWGLNSLTLANAFTPVFLC